MNLYGMLNVKFRFELHKSIFFDFCPKYLAF